MATNFTQDGDRLTLTAPSGGVVKDKVYVIGDLVVVALGSAAEGADFVGCRRGVFALDKEADLAITAGDIVFWATDTLEATADETDKAVGYAIADAAADDDTVEVVLTPDMSPNVLASVLAIPKHNFAAGAAPGVGDDSADGYSVGSMWFDTTNDEIYGCVDASEGAAVWKQLSNAA